MINFLNADRAPSFLHECF